jgi:hypothetical protein
MSHDTKELFYDFKIESIKAEIDGKFYSIYDGFSHNFQ